MERMWARIAKSQSRFCSSKLASQVAPTVAMIVLLALPAFAQDVPQQHESPPVVHGDVSEDTLMYAMLESPPPALKGSAQIMQRLAPFNNSRFGGRPMLLWHHWANQKKKFGASLIFLLFWVTLISSCAPRWIASAQTQCKTHFWRTYLYGILAVTIGVTAVRASLLTMIGWPLAILCGGVLQLALVCGISVLSLLMGQSLGHHLRFEKWITRPDVRRLAHILLGSIICAALLQIPGMGTLPRIGTRLVAMLAVVGLGGLLRARRIQSEAVK